MSAVDQPPAGYSPDELNTWIDIVGDLADLIRTDDPRATWRYINSLNATQLRLLAFTAISGFDTKKPYTQTYAWLPQRADAGRRVSPRERADMLAPSLSFLEQYQELHHDMGLSDREVAQRMKPPITIDSYVRQLYRYGFSHDDTVAVAS